MFSLPTSNCLLWAKKQTVYLIIAIFYNHHKLKLNCDIDKIKLSIHCSAISKQTSTASWFSTHCQVVLHLLLAGSPSVVGWFSICCWLVLHLLLTSSPSVVGQFSIYCWLVLHLQLAGFPSVVSWFSICCWLVLHLVLAGSPQAPAFNTTLMITGTD